MVIMSEYKYKDTPTGKAQNSVLDKNGFIYHITDSVLAMDVKQPQLFFITSQAAGELPNVFVFYAAIIASNAKNLKLLMTA